MEQVKNVFFAAGGGQPEVHRASGLHAYDCITAPRRKWLFRGLGVRV